jgi:hypothetical protein
MFRSTSSTRSSSAHSGATRISVRRLFFAFILGTLILDVALLASGVNKILIINREIAPGRITVVLVDEVLGF